MARRSNLKHLDLPRDEKIEVIATCPGKETIKKEMTYGQALNLPKRKGWTYRNYQLRFSQYKTE